MSYQVYELEFKPVKDNPKHVGLYVELDKGQGTGRLVHSTDFGANKGPNNEVHKFRFQDKPFTPRQSRALETMKPLGTIQKDGLDKIHNIAKSIAQPQRPKHSSAKAPNCRTWYFQFLNKLRMENVIKETSGAGPSGSK